MLRHVIRFGIRFVKLIMHLVLALDNDVSFRSGHCNCDSHIALAVTVAETTPIASGMGGISLIHI